MAKNIIYSKKGNVILMILPIGIMLLIIVLVIIILLYIQISVQIFDMKSNLFYLVQSSINMENFEKIAYRDYSLNTNIIKENLNILLEKNYLSYSNKKVGIVKIRCKDIKVISSKEEVIKHTKKIYNAPVICINVEFKFNPIISFLGREINLNMHDDIKLSLLEFERFGGI